MIHDNLTWKFTHEETVSRGLWLGDCEGSPATLKIQ